MAGAAGGLGAAMVGSRMAEAAVPSAEPAPPPVASPWTDRQFEIYLAGRRGVKPARPVSVEQLEKAAQQAMSPEAFGYVAGGAGSEEWEARPASATSCLNLLADLDLTLALTGCASVAELTPAHLVRA